MYKLLAVALIIAAVSAQSAIPTWAYDSFDHWCAKYGKTYDSPAEKEYRVGVYYTNMVFIHTSNTATTSYTLAVNGFADLTVEEFLEMYTGLNVTPTKMTERKERKLQAASVNETVDWVSAGAVTAIKNQGQCGDCWAFSTTGSVEGVYFLSGNPLTSFSEQQLTDCSDSFGNMGCNGGLMDDAFKYIEQNGIETESDYPFRGVDQKCQYKSSDVVFKITDYTDVPASDNDALQVAVNQQPVSIAIDAENIMFYSSGVFDNKNCGTQLDHGVLAVGYGTDSTTNQPYWLVKNSWGTSWGEAGYIRFLRASGQGTAICGLNLMASYPEYSS